MILYRDFSWWCWAVTAVLLIVGLAGRFEAFVLAAGLSGLQIVYFRLREGGFTAFPVQVRLAYAGILAVALWRPWLFWIPAIGTVAQVLFGYCLLARTLSLLPWNRPEPLSWRLVWRTFASRPVRGNILQDQPAGSSFRSVRRAGADREVLSPAHLNRAGGPAARPARPARRAR